ncbi:SAM-dependent RNA methyltransferase, putative [Plasmodium chabaudi chabaudi]|uniref:SAM-dependent RNA methyltransferase, putative n=1 Tax=Plasmodium chabaudi chabaudi TaxID=31271 RepID=A0A077TPL3_PLACU|nr:SAM-dependent RNA methyltransferase, putative [Plasmodium chabaudi chabaudi]SCM08937.1 SAM-dependent RNA methyltransferase, putative [Plasmodium chabaudi chabaudi]VTZ70471.1 SAM-dependent RNA methyltransferase, putative [Plasmodium chabaudi chabaudi]|eukprot:XP_734308.2 SAM-dependent RNA methyltransferase, putative [Plasmodium chabaudi chabaudi]
MGVKFIVEHMDDLEEWCILEYMHICEIVKDENIIFTKFKDNFKDISKVYEPKCYEKSIGDLKNEFEWNKICLLDMKAKDVLTCKDKNEIGFLLFGGILGNVPSNDRTSELRKFEFPISRNLGSVQMTTNTAVLVCHIILNDQVELENIPFVDNPDITLKNDKESMMLPFRFVSKYYYTKCENDKNIPILPNNFKDYLIKLGDQQYNDLDSFF